MLVLSDNDLKDDINLDVKANSKLSLQIISEFPEGFLKIVEILHEKFSVLDEVFKYLKLIGF